METAEKKRHAISKDRNEGRHLSDKGSVVALHTLNAQRPQQSTNSTTEDLFQVCRTDFQSKLSSLRRAKHATVQSHAEEIYAVVCEFLRQITGAISFRDALARLAREYWAESAIVQLLEECERRAQAIFKPRPSATMLQSYRPQEEISRLLFFLNWLVQREASLRFFSEHSVVEAAGVGIRNVLHDRFFSGVRGFEVTVAVRLEGFEYQSLWLRLQLFAHGKPIMVRSRWQTWREDAELYVMAQGRSEEVRDALFADIAPIVAIDQRLIADSATLFVPYAALELAAQIRTEIDCEVSLLNEAGMTLSADACTEVVALPAPVAVDVPVPSALSLGFWPHSIGSNDRISNLSLQQRSGVVADREVHMIVVAGDVQVVNQKGRELAVEVRVLSVDGHAVESEIERFRASDGTFLFREPLHPEQVIAHYAELQLSFPVVALEMDCGQQDVFFEIVVIDEQRKVLCGAMQRAEILIPDISALASRLGDEDVQYSLDSVLAIRGVKIDQRYQFNGRDAVRVELQIVDSSDITEICHARLGIRSLASVQDSPGISIHRGLSFERKESEQEFRLVFVVDSEEFIAPHPSAQHSGHYELVLDVLNQRGVSLLTTKKNLVLDRDFGRERALWFDSAYRSPSYEIIDCQVHRTPLRGGEILVDFFMNIDPQTAQHEKMSCYFDIQPLDYRSSPSTESNRDGCASEIEVLPIRTVAGAVLASFQYHHQVRLPQSFYMKTSSLLKFMLFSSVGRLLQVIYVPLAPRKLDRSGCRRGSETTLSDSARSSESDLSS